MAKSSNEDLVELSLDPSIRFQRLERAVQCMEEAKQGLFNPDDFQVHVQVETVLSATKGNVEVKSDIVSKEDSLEGTLQVCYEATRSASASPFQMSHTDKQNMHQ